MKKRLMGYAAATTAQRILGVFYEMLREEEMSVLSRLQGEQEMADLFRNICDLVDAEFEQKRKKRLMSDTAGITSSRIVCDFYGMLREEEMAALDPLHGEQEMANLSCKICDLVEAGLDSFEEMMQQRDTMIRPKRN